MMYITEVIAVVTLLIVLWLAYRVGKLINQFQSTNIVVLYNALFLQDMFPEDYGVKKYKQIEDQS